MAERALQVCNEAGCNQIVRAARCKEHERREYERKHRAMYNRRWERKSRQHRADNPLCVVCAAEGLAKAAYCTDHVVPHRGDEVLFWDAENWQSLCERCHNEKTGRGE
jgi:5-methylcytosine-specific restriction protein A